MTVRDKNHPRYAYYERYMVIKNHKWRMKLRDTEAVILTPDNAEALAYLCNGTVITVDGAVMIKFQGLTQMEFAVEGQYFIRTIMPGEEYFASMGQDMFHRLYERVTWTEQMERRNS